MADLITDFYRQNEWANLRLIEVCRGLTDEQLDATAVGAYGSIRGTLAHLVGSEAGYVRRLGGSPRRALERGGGWPGFDVLEEVVRSSADGLIERAGAVGGSTVIEAGDSGGRFELEANVMLVQAINHSTEHRSQICTILTALGALPSTGDDGQTIIDAWSWADANGLARPIEG